MKITIGYACSPLCKCKHTSNYDDSFTYDQARAELVSCAFIPDGLLSDTEIRKLRDIYSESEDSLRQLEQHFALFNSL